MTYVSRRDEITWQALAGAGVDIDRITRGVDGFYTLRIEDREVCFGVVVENDELFGYDVCTYEWVPFPEGWNDIAQHWFLSFEELARFLCNWTVVVLDEYGIA